MRYASGDDGLAFIMTSGRCSTTGRYTHEHGTDIFNDGTHLGDGTREPLTPDYQRFIHGLGIVA